jgi:hypothetical protein
LRATIPVNTLGRVTPARYMWTVNSESGKLNAVLIQDSTEQLWTKKMPFAGIESNTHYISRDPHAQINPGHQQWLQLPKILKSQGVQVFEVIEILGRIIENATIAELDHIVEDVWSDTPSAPNPEDLTVDHLTWGNPPIPYFDPPK